MSARASLSDAHAVRACYAALRMHELVRSYAEEARRALEPTVPALLALLDVPVDDVRPLLPDHGAH